jgi:two-component system, LytTR family, response regulator
MIPEKNTITKPADQYDFILVKTETKGKFLKIDTADIDYIEGMDNYVAIFCRGKKTVAFINMKDLEEKLPKDKFMRVHKSFIVAIDKIVSIEGNSLLLKNNVQAGILIGNAYRTAFLEKMKSRLID